MIHTFLPSTQKHLFKVNNKITKTSSEYLSAGYTVDQNESRKAPMLESPFDKVVGRQAFKQTSTQVFSCEYCEIFKNSYFEDHLWWLLLSLLLTHFPQCSLKMFPHEKPSNILRGFQKRTLQGNELT